MVRLIHHPAYPSSNKSLSMGTGLGFRAEARIQPPFPSAFSGSRHRRPLISELLIPGERPVNDLVQGLEASSSSLIPGERPVNDLVAALGLGQPQKRLTRLRDALRSL
jgi:hypothetical protein